MDCISGRKNTGRITGDVRVNGHPQVLPMTRDRPFVSIGL